MAMRGVALLLMGLGLAASEEAMSVSGSYTAPEPAQPEYQVRKRTTTDPSEVYEKLIEQVTAAVPCMNDQDIAV